MRVFLIAFGKLKTPGLREAADYYSKLLGSWITFREIELKPLMVPDKSPATRELIQSREAELLFRKIDEFTTARGAVYLLDEEGKSMPTRTWADQVRTWERESIPDITIVIGSSLGFSDSVRKRTRGSFALGPQTLSHELARVVILEQLYRAWSVTRGHPYHNEGS